MHMHIGTHEGLVPNTTLNICCGHFTQQMLHWLVI